LLRVGYEHFPFPRSLWFDSQPQFLLPSPFSDLAEAASPCPSVC
jgi:hypothetical protein